MGGESGERNTLSRKDEFALMTWLSCQRERLERDRPRRASVAAEAAEALGFAVSLGNVNGCLADLGITWQSPREGTPGGGGKVLAALRAEVQALAARVDGLAKDVAEERRLRKLAEARLFALEETATTPTHKLTAVR